MFGLKIIEVIIGLSLVYLLGSLVCSALKEWIDRLFTIRARDLEKRLIILLGDALATQFYDHPFIKGISQKPLIHKIVGLLPFVTRESKPTHIKAEIFSATLWDILYQKGRENGKAQETPPKKDSEKTEAILEYLKQGISQLIPSAQPGESESSAITAIANSTEVEKTDKTESKDLVRNFRQQVENWFNNSMEEMSAWSKQKARVIIFWIAVPLCVILNIDSFMIGNFLYNDDAARNTLVELAEKRIEKMYPARPGTDNRNGQNDGSTPASITPAAANTAAGTGAITGTTGTTAVKGTGKAPEAGNTSQASIEKAKELVAEMQQLGIPLGWECNKKQDKDIRGTPVKGGWLNKILGILLSVFAISMGAPFWVDLLRKLIPARKILSQLTPPAEKQQE